MSASSRPTLLPCFRRARARFAATVLLPTPPLPLMTRTMSVTPGTGSSSAMARMPASVGPGGRPVNSALSAQDALFRLAVHEGPVHSVQDAHLVGLRARTVVERRARRVVEVAREGDVLAGVHDRRRIVPELARLGLLPFVGLVERSAHCRVVGGGDEMSALLVHVRP